MLLLVRIVGKCDDVEDRIDFFRVSEDVFFSQPSIRDSILVPVSQIGELAGKLSEEARAWTGGKTFWARVRGFRNYFVHDYDNLNVGIAWDAVSRDIPSLRNSLLGIEEVKVSYEEDVSYKRTTPDFQDLDDEYLNAVLHGHRFVGSDHEHL